MKLFKDIGALIILWFVLCVTALSLAGCSRKTPVDDAFNEVNTSIVALKEELPPQCKTDIVLKRIEKLESDNRFAEQACKSKIKDTQMKYERVLWVLGFLLLGIFVKIFIKK